MNRSALALEQLISQFSQPLAFLRELVQNSLDAGTALVEVEVGFDQPSSCCFIRVRDTGVGMTREIIDNELTRLFSSSKEDDLTKIGKFGIGFVSIFAINPSLIVLETGRDGQFWRVLFKPDRSFERRQLHHPVEGTCVTLYLQRPKNKLSPLRKEVKETLIYWCKHCQVEINFEGEQLNRPFSFPGKSYQYRHLASVGEIILQPTDKPPFFQGYYNRGLTLLEKDGEDFPFLNFKVRSPYLEHTLSRDNIIEDKEYLKVKKEIEKAAYQKLPDDLFKRLCQKDDRELWQAAKVVIDFVGVKKLIADYPIFKGGQHRYCLSQLPKEICAWPQVDDFWEACQKNEEIILQGASDFPSFELLEKLGFTLVPLNQLFFHYESVPVDNELKPLFTELSHLNELFDNCRLLKHRDSRPVTNSSPMFVFCSSESRARRILDKKRRAGENLGLFCDHPLFAKVLTIFQSQPELAQVLLLRKLNLDLDRQDKDENRYLKELLTNLFEKSGSP